MSRLGRVLPLRGAAFLSPSPSGEGLGVGLCLAERFTLLDCPTPTPPLKGRG